jgi:hypothetical protein
VKVFKSTMFGENSDLLDNFKKEVELILKLKNKYIIRFYGYMMETNYSIIFEYCNLFKKN